MFTGKIHRIFGTYLYECLYVYFGEDFQTTFPAFSLQFLPLHFIRIFCIYAYECLYAPFLRRFSKKSNAHFQRSFTHTKKRHFLVYFWNYIFCIFGGYYTLTLSGFSLAFLEIFLCDIFADISIQSAFFWCFIHTIVYTLFPFIIWNVFYSYTYSYNNLSLFSITVKTLMNNITDT